MLALHDARILVTGATGFIGSHLTRRLVAEGSDVHALVASVSRIYPHRLVPLRKAITLHEANLLDRTALTSTLRDVRPHVLVHLGAYTHVAKSWKRVDECFLVNVQGTINLVQAAADIGYERFINVGSSEIYGGISVPFRETDCPRPISPYSVSKYAAEQYCRIMHAGQDQPIVLVRPFNVYGPAQAIDRVIPEVIVRGLRRQELKLTSGQQTREFNYVEDVCDGLVRTISTPGVEGELFNIGCGEETSVRGVTELLLELIGTPIEPQFGSLPHRPNEIWRMCSDNSKARNLLGWTPQFSLREGLKATVAWYEEELKRADSSYAAAAD